jgi:hypothetical protein
MTAISAIGLEKQNGWDIGRDPRRISREELVAAGHKPISPLKALRLRCIDCCADQPSEVRLCTAVTCPSWPFRMGSNPWRSPSEGRRESGRRLARERSSSDGNRKSDLSASATPDVAATILPLEQSSTGETAVLSDAARRTAVGGDAVR